MCTCNVLCYELEGNSGGFTSGLHITKSESQKDVFGEFDDDNTFKPPPTQLVSTRLLQLQSTRLA